MNRLKSHFAYDRQKRSGILLLIAFILIGLGTYFFWPAPTQVFLTEENQKQLLAIQSQIDSLKQIKQEENKPKLYPFNPNFITDYKGYTLGMSVEEIDRLHSFRESRKWINSIADFKKVTQVSDSLLDAISPLFKFPNWVTNPKLKSGRSFAKKTKEQKKALNQITIPELTAYEGIDKELAIKMLYERKRMGGFLIDNQLYDIWGVSKKAVRAILEDYTVKEVPIIEKIDINKATASDLSTIKYINFDLAKEIVDYRTLREGIKEIAELERIEGINDYLLERIKLYIFISKN